MPEPAKVLVASVVIGFLICCAALQAKLDQIADSLGAAWDAHAITEIVEFFDLGWFKQHAESDAAPFIADDGSVHCDDSSKLVTIIMYTYNA